jgi:hypothetical protein
MTGIVIGNTEPREGASFWDYYYYNRISTRKVLALYVVGVINYWQLEGAELG